MNKVGRFYIGNLEEGRNASEKDYVAMVSMTNHEVGFNGPHLWIQIHDGMPWSNDVQRRIVKFIAEHIHEGDIMVHCDAGISRSSSVVILWLMSVGFDKSVATTIVKNNHEFASPSPKILDNLYPRELK